MFKTYRSQLVLAIVVALAGTVSFAQSRGEVVYKTTCKMCHGATGAADTPTARMFNVKPVTDPDIMKLTDHQMFPSVKNGKGAMKPMPALTDTQIEDSIFYFRGFAK
ncbi:MAG: c-type cytochrome [Terracidiphilus sp.]|jgi:mono/diheme cytochrome c family protein